MVLFLWDEDEEEKNAHHSIGNQIGKALTTDLLCGGGVGGVGLNMLHSTNKLPGNLVFRFVFYVSTVMSCNELRFHRKI